MYKVILVDDEIWSLEGIRKLFEWEEMGFAVTAQVTDAAEAYELIVSTNPDVVVTDIRMPEMSGIELLHQSRRQGMDCEFIIISGFAEFQYAQEALRHGAFDYQLKPIERIAAGNLLARLKAHLAKKKSAEHMELLKQISLGRMNAAELSDHLHFHPDGAHWQVAIVEGSGADDISAADHLLSGMHRFTFRIGEGKAVLLLNGGSKLEAEVWRGLSSGRWASGASMGISSMTQDAERLPALIKEAEMAAAQRFITGQPGVVQFNAKACAAAERFAKQLEKLLMLKDFAEISDLVDSIPELFEEHRLGIPHAVALWNEVAVLIRKRLESDASAIRLDFLDYEEMLAKFDSLPSLCRTMKQVLQQMCCAGTGGLGKSQHYNGNFIALLEYVNQNYNKELALGELAERFYLNMSYCSELFKKVTGYTFSDYVTRLRMEAAAELIRTGEHSADYVCRMTGYNDYYYFSKIFKKFHGVPPSQLAGRGVRSS